MSGREYPRVLATDESRVQFVVKTLVDILDKLDHMDTKLDRLGKRIHTMEENLIGALDAQAAKIEDLGADIQIVITGITAQLATRDATIADLTTAVAELRAALVNEDLDDATRDALVIQLEASIQELRDGQAAERTQILQRLQASTARIAEIDTTVEAAINPPTPPTP